MPKAVRSQCYQASIEMGNKLLMQSARLRSSTPGTLVLVSACSAGQDDLSALHDRMRQRPGIRKGPQLLNLVLVEDQRRHRTTKRHKAPRVTLPFLARYCRTAR